MSASNKTLWVVNYNTLDEFFATAANAKVTAVAIRTDNDLVKAIARFHKASIKVFAWRWPSAQSDAAMQEASIVANLLRNEDLDGFFADPEGAPGQPYDWDRPGLAGLADEFSAAIKQAAPDKPFGVTSHYLAKFVYPNIPWATFFKYADVLLPQSYWRSTAGVIGHGVPSDNYAVGIDRWTKTGGDKTKIVPMAGEIAVSTAKEIGQYAAAAQTLGIASLHFYASEPSVKQAVWSAIAGT